MDLKSILSEAYGDRRFAFSRNPSFRQRVDSSVPFRPNLSRSDSSISIAQTAIGDDDDELLWTLGGGGGGESKQTLLSVVSSLLMSLIRAARSGNRPMKRLALMISLNVAYSLTELTIGLLTGRVGLVSDAFHLTFGCGLLTFSLFAMATSHKKPDGVYTYGYKRLEVLAAFTNAVFLLFMSFSLAVEALHAFIQDESEHKHYLIVSAVTNLLVNLLGVWFFRSYARVNIVYRKVEDMNYHSVCLHVLADSIRSAGLILASWFLSLGIENAEVLCLGLVAVAVLIVILPLFQATGSLLLQMAPASIPTSALGKGHRQITALEDVSEVAQSRFWELVPGHAIGSLSIQVMEPRFFPRLRFDCSPRTLYGYYYHVRSLLNLQEDQTIPLYGILYGEMKPVVCDVSDGAEVYFERVTYYQVIRVQQSQNSNP